MAVRHKSMGGLHETQESKTNLQLRQVLWPPVDVHPAQADANGARRDDDDLVAILPQLHRRFHYRRQDGEEGLVGLFVDDGARPWGGELVMPPAHPLRGLGRNVVFCSLTQLDHDAKRTWAPHGCRLGAEDADPGSATATTTTRTRTTQRERGTKKPRQRPHIASPLRDFSGESRGLTQAPAHFHYIAPGPRLSVLVSGVCCNFWVFPSMQQLTSDQWAHCDGGCQRCWVPREPVTRPIGRHREGPRNPGSPAPFCWASPPEREAKPTKGRICRR